MEKVLILGGTHFIGRNLVEKLFQSNQFEITLFNRGISNPRLFEGINRIQGNRDTNDISKISNQHWDYVIDTSCYYPNSLSNVLSALRNTPKRYVFISTCSVYDNDILKSELRDERAPILSCTLQQRTDTSPQTYGHRKAECERILQSSGLPFSIMRPALVYGKYDTSDRFYYWLYQLKKADRLLVPNEGKKVFSVTYVSDLIHCIISTLNSSLESDVYNTTSTPSLSLSRLIATSGKVIRRKVDALSATSEFLSKNNVSEWTDIPLWLDCDYFTYSNSKARKSLGLNPIDLEISIRETTAYFDSLNWPEPAFGMTDERKKQLVDRLSGS